MSRTPALVEIHYALWGVLAVPIGFAGTFFVMGLFFVWALVLLTTATLLILYVTKLSRRVRIAWLLGVIAHAALLVAALYYVPHWPQLLAIPLALLNLYSLGVLLFYRAFWNAPMHAAAEAQLA